MQILNLKKSQILTFDEYLETAQPEEPLEKALFKHAYYSHLVPTVILGKDGIKRIHWVNPDKGKPKMNLVGHFHEGERTDHHTQLTTDNVIDLNHVTHFASGDKVRIKSGKYKGQVGIFTGSYSTTGNVSPRTSIKFPDASGIWKTANPISASNLELVHRATDQTKDAIAPKSVATVNRFGQPTVVSKTYLATKKDTGPVESAQARHERMGRELTPGIMFARASDGAKVLIHSEALDGKLHLKLIDASPKAKKEGFIEKTHFQKLVDAGTYHRVGISPHAPGTTHQKSRMLETGELHHNGSVTYDQYGRPTLKHEVLMAIIFENWANVKRTISLVTAAFPTVDESELSGVDMMDQIQNAVNTFEPYHDTPVSQRIHFYVKDAAKKKASQMHEINKLRVRRDQGDDDTSSDGLDKINTDDDSPTNELDLGGGGFVNKLDALTFDDILEDEADMVRWVAGNDEFADVVMRMTGLGVREATITKDEAAKELFGKMVNSAGIPLTLNSIRNKLTRFYNTLVDEFRAEIQKDPTFEHTLRLSIQMRDKMHRKRDIIESGDLKTMKAVAKKFDGGRNARGDIAAMLIKHGADVASTGNLVKMTEDILSGTIKPVEYSRVIQSEAHAQALQDTLKEMIKASTATGSVPDRFNVHRWFKYDPKAGGKILHAWLSPNAMTTIGKK
ncbi:MAG: hypothetical protein JEZ11_24655 [Desulfobacterales bacterium]|nr:hypothetical protein [Desulfobacterales bacterium]